MTARREQLGAVYASAYFCNRFMGGGTGEKKQQLGKIMLQQRLVSQGELKEILVEQRREGGRLASSAARHGHISMGEALGALAEQHGVPPADLTRTIMALSILRLIPREMAEERAVLPIRVDGDRLLLAMASPGDQEVIEELEFVAGKTVVPHVSLDQVLREAISHAYDRLEAGDEYYVGAQVTEAELAQHGLPDLPRAPQPKFVTPEEAELADLPLTDEELFAAEEVVTAPPAKGPPLPPPPAAGAAIPPAAPVAPPPPPGSGLDEAFAQRTAASQPPVIPTHDRSAKVLIVDSSLDTRASLRGTLQETGITVFEAADGLAALAQVERHTPKVVVVEAELPSAGGLELCRQLRALSHADVPVILLSSSDTGWRVQRDLARVLGVRHVFSKPADLVKLTRTVRLLLEDQDVDNDLPALGAEAERQWNAGMDAFERGDLDRAIAELEAGVLVDPDAFELQYHLGLLYGRREQLFLAMAALGKAVRLQPKHFSALKNLAVIYQRASFRHQAIDAWERALEASPDDETRKHIRDHMVQLLS